MLIPHPGSDRKGRIIIGILPLVIKNNRGVQGSVCIESKFMIRIRSVSTYQTVYQRRIRIRISRIELTHHGAGVEPLNHG